MAAGYIPDPIVENILTRLQAKPLLRFRCVSKHWNSLITDPHFMSSRSCRKLVLTTRTHLLMIDDNVTLGGTCQNSILKVPYPCENLKSDKPATILGSLNGLVLLRYPGRISKYPMILYNPFTRASKKIPCSEYSSDRFGNAYRFGYGATTDDLRIIVLYNRHGVYNPTNIACEVFNLKTSSWSTCTLQDTNIKKITPKDPVGTFLNGYLYWIKHVESKLIALNLKDMVLSEIHLPFQRKFNGDQLCTIHGRLCLINIDYYCFCLWVMNGQGVQNSWSNICSRKVCLDGYRFFKPICPLDDGKLLTMNLHKGQLIVYDTSNDSYIVMNSLIGLDEMYGIEYVESLVSPSYVCDA